MAKASLLARSAPEVSPRTRRLALSAMGLLTLVGLLGTALSPSLVAEYPLTLLGLNPDGRHLVLVAGHVEHWQAILVGAFRRALTVFAMFGVAYVFGHSLLARLDERPPWVRTLVARVESVFARAGLLMVVIAPFFWVAAFAGAARMHWRTFLVAMLPGQFALTSLYLYAGDVFSPYTDGIVAFIADNSVSLTLGAVLLVLTQELVRRRRGYSLEVTSP